EDNLDSIKIKENLISIEKQREVKLSQKDRINNDILTIYKLLHDNKIKLAKMNRTMKKYDIQLTELNKLIDRMHEQLSAKDLEISLLREELEKKNILISGLMRNIDSLFIESEVKTTIIEGQIKEMNKAYYIIASKRDLKDKGIIESRGLSTPVISSNLNKEEFNLIDITKVEGLPLFSKKAKILSTHPTNSYSIQTGKFLDSLVITNPKEFWSITKFLVVMGD
ncbi:MAG: hypothetical protein SNJ64_05975, partial [Endomicrobiia bacterium]